MYLGTLRQLLPVDFAPTRVDPRDADWSNQSWGFWRIRTSIKTVFQRNQTDESFRNKRCKPAFPTVLLPLDLIWHCAAFYYWFKAHFKEYVKVGNTNVATRTFPNRFFKAQKETRALSTKEMKFIYWNHGVKYKEDMVKWGRYFSSDFFVAGSGARFSKVPKTFPKSHS